MGELKARGEGNCGQRVHLLLHSYQSELVSLEVEVGVEAEVEASLVVFVSELEDSSLLFSLQEDPFLA